MNVCMYHDALPVCGEGLQVADVADARVTEQRARDGVEVARQNHLMFETEHLPYIITP